MVCSMVLDMFSCRFIMPCVPPVVCRDACRFSGVDLDSGYGTLTFDKPDVVTFRNNTISKTVADSVRLLLVQQWFNVHPHLFDEYSVSHGTMIRPCLCSANKYI